MNKYDHREVEKKWQKVWDKEGLHTPDIKKAKKDNFFYNLWMFPYPSAEGMHVGTAFSSTGSDVYGRYQRMNGKVVFQPIGYDSFGIHSENYALKIKEQPQDLIARTTANFKRQFKTLGHGYDWTRTVTTSDIDYYRWTQWIFTTFFKAGLAYKKSAKVNFCPSCKTVLADEQVMTPKQAFKDPKDVSGNLIKNASEDLRVCERCGTVVEMRELAQWFFRITDYAEKLLDNLVKIDWPKKVKIGQKEWIGKSKGLTIDFKVDELPQHLRVWTKFWETVYGVTFIVVSPEYAEKNLKNLVSQKYAKKVNTYIFESLKKSDEQRSQIKEKTGVETGIYAQNPVNGEKVPIFVADYVLAGVGTGAVMGVPAHDERDFAFARKYKLPIRKVVDITVETHSLVIKKSVTDKFIEKIKEKGWFFTNYESWGWGVVFPKGGEEEYIKIVQSTLKDGPWYVRTDGVLKEAIFKSKHFSIEKENDKAKAYARSINIPESQIDWDERDNYLFAHEKGGNLVNSGNFNGLDAWGEGKEKMAEWMISEGFANWETNYHLRDWLISRQRYWGCPIPMIYCKTCANEGRSWFTLQGQAFKGVHKNQSDWNSTGWYPEESLPVELPRIKDWKPEGTGKGPLANHPDFYEVKCPHCGSSAERETDVADTFLDSAWYFLRYPSVDSESSTNLPFDPGVSTKTLPVDLYFGGAEHTVLHLMYARFVNMVLHDLDYLDHEEPFPKFFAHGLMIKDGAKMSKSRGNVVNPDEYIEKYGADTLRLYLMFMGPMDGYPDFRDTGIEGMQRFVRRLWNVFTNHDKGREEDQEITAKMHQTIKKVTTDVSTFNYNTAISAVMEYVNLITEKKNYADSYLRTLAKLIAPFAPHLAEEVWQMYLNNPSDTKGQKFTSVHTQSWPTYDEKYLQAENVEIIIQVNGKLRSTLRVANDEATDKEKVISMAQRDEKTEYWLKGKEIKNTVFVPGKLINFVV